MNLPEGTPREIRSSGGGAASWLVTAWEEIVMTFRKTVSVLLVFLMVMSGCSKKTDETTGTTETTGAGSEASVTEESVTENTEDTTAQTETESATSEIELTETSKKEPEPIVFDPHLHSAALDVACKEGYWESFDNMVDAIMAGEDTFKCTSKEAYDWCASDVVINYFMPAACGFVFGDGYEDGVGKLRYEKPKEEFLAREKTFEEESMKILNACVKSDYTDFEKALSLYVYIAENFTYAYEDEHEVQDQSPDGFGVYRCMMKKHGICFELSGVYTFLLRQCGIDSLKISGEGDVFHEWSYVYLYGKPYHVDVTWGRAENDPSGEVPLRFFMETDMMRIEDGFVFNTFVWNPLSWWVKDIDKNQYVVEENTYDALHQGKFIALDTEKKVVRFREGDEEKEWKYE